MIKNKEKEHEAVFGRSFARYEPTQMEDFIRPFKTRFEANSIDASNIFLGSGCLDAGCGGGRGSMFMLKHGASHVSAVDVSETNVRTTNTNLSSFGNQRYSVSLSSLESLPFGDESFDFVWCYGVLQHTAEPDRCLEEIVRVLKKHGKMFLFVYGEGGLYWYFVRRFRNMLRNLSAEFCHNALTIIGSNVNDFTSFMDDWKAAYLRCYRRKDFEEVLNANGMKIHSHFRYGVEHDLNHRLNSYSEDVAWVGEGDLRYLLTKSGKKNELEKTSLKDAEIEALVIERHIAERFDDYFEEISNNSKDNDFLTLQLCVFIHKRLLSIMATKGPLNLCKLTKIMENAVLLSQIEMTN